MKLTSEDISQLQQNRFWSELRAKVCSWLRERKGTFYEWELIAGRKSRDQKGNRIRLSKDTLHMLQQIVDYLNSEEGQVHLMQIGIEEIPQDTDELLGKIMNATPLNYIKEKEFQIFIQYRQKILDYLQRVL